ncbi:ArgS-related anticodon-binding protein NrtL [Streptomyces sp. NPDC005423]|uniref:ArgS-related anticodon-binding protein NrtL n=1 Tax=Streptomyces sp. NPDC005423 TaxID=3155343 RepID=UPI0033B0F32F
MTPVELSRTVLRAVRRAVDGGELAVAVPERVLVDVPGPGGCGDYATTIALQLARPAGMPPRRVAEVLRPYLADARGVAGVEITGPGFLNISLDAGLRGTASAALVEEILRQGPRYGFAPRPLGQTTASAPTGQAGTPTPTPRPIHLRAPHDLRALVVTDVIARLLRSQGALVRTGCVARPEPEWVDVLGVGVDAYGTVDDPAPLDVDVRPVPAAEARDVLALGRDAGRWALLCSAPHDRPHVTAELLVQRESNPLFRVRYAHARTRAALRNASDLGFTPEPGDVENVEDGHPAQAARPVHPAPVEHALLVLLGEHPRVLARAAGRRAPDRLVRQLVAVADVTLPVLSSVLPLGGEKPSAAHRARLALAEAAGAVLAGGLALLGIDAPECL